MFVYIYTLDSPLIKIKVYDAENNNTQQLYLFEKLNRVKLGNSAAASTTAVEKPLHQKDNALGHQGHETDLSLHRLSKEE